MHKASLNLVWVPFPLKGRDDGERTTLIGSLSRVVPCDVIRVILTDFKLYDAQHIIYYLHRYRNNMFTIF